MKEEGKIKWTENRIAAYLAHNLFNGRSVLVVPRCRWTGHECDLLVVDRKSLKVIDVEIKVSRADLKADASKEKWWKRGWSVTYANRHTKGSRIRQGLSQRKDWPDKVWKHYYVMPASIWDDKLLDALPPCSGVILMDDLKARVMSVKRRAKPSKDAKPLSATACIDIARLSSLRMWDALVKAEDL